MRLRRFALVVVLSPLLALTSTHCAAGGQSVSPAGTGTSTPLPSVTAAPIPSGGRLLARMQQAMRVAGSVRYVTTELGVTKTERVTVTTHADLSWRRNLLRERDLTRTIVLNRHPAVGTVYRRTLLFARQMAASRSSLNHDWYCEQLRGVHISHYFLPFQIGTPPATNLGPATMGGMAIWHVQATGVTVYAWATHAATVDFYIAQVDDMLQGLDIHFTGELAGKAVRESIEERYSRYREVVTVTLPAACQPTAPRQRGALR